MNNYNIILDLTTTHKTMSFDDFCKLIQKKELLIKTKLLLKEFTLTVKPQILLTVYLLNNFNTILLHPENDKNLLILCKTIIKNITFYIKKPSSNLKLLLSKIITLFNTRFTSWKNKDVQSQITYYCSSFCELQDIINTTKHEIYKQEIVKIQVKLKNKIIKLDKQNGESFLLDFQKKYLQKKKKTDQLLIDKLTKTMKEAFWNKLTFDLQKTPPNLNQIPSILKDINLAFHTLVPKKNKIKESIDEYLNYEFLQQLIDKKCFSNEKIIDLVDFCFNLLKQLGIPEKDKEINELLQWNQTMKQKKELKLQLYLPKVFKEILNRIEEIQNRILILQKISK